MGSFRSDVAVGVVDGLFPAIGPALHVDGPAEGLRERLSAASHESKPCPLAAAGEVEGLPVDRVGGGGHGGALKGAGLNKTVWGLLKKFF